MLWLLDNIVLQVSTDTIICVFYNVDLFAAIIYINIHRSTSIVKI